MSFGLTKHVRLGHATTMKQRPDLTLFDSKPSLQDAAALWLETALQDALTRRGSAAFLGSGGSTPGPIYERLSQAPLDWHNIWVGLTDERWVAADHPASNGAMLQRTLLTGAAAQATYVPMKTAAEDPFDAVEEVDELYQDAALPDVVLLGMGPDAHTLSWFPDARGLSAALDPDSLSTVAAIAAPQTEVTGPNMLRMTLTLPCIAYARKILLLITGAEKKRVFETADSHTPIGQLCHAAGDALTVFYAE